jgi:hypothetical protein
MGSLDFSIDLIRVSGMFLKIKGGRQARKVDNVTAICELIV